MKTIFTTIFIAILVLLFYRFFSWQIEEEKRVKEWKLNCSQGGGIVWDAGMTSLTEKMWQCIRPEELLLKQQQ